DGTLVFVTGTSEQQSTQDFLTVAYDASAGTQVWASAYDDHFRAEYACCLAVTGSEVFVTGTSSRSYELTDSSTVAYDVTTGRQLWAARYDSGGYDAPYAIAADPGGTAVYVTGTSLGDYA